MRRAARRAGIVIVPVALMLVAGACESPLAPDRGAAYDFTLELDGPVVYRWPAGSRLGVYVAGGEDPARVRLLAGALADAAADWRDALGSDAVRFVPVRNLADAAVVLRWSDVPAPVDTAGCAPRVAGRAATTFCRTADGLALEPFPLASPEGGRESPVRMIVTVLAEEATGPARVRQLVAHELGHVLGIGRHSPDPNDLMWDGPLRRTTPSDADLATVRRLYATPPDLVP